MKFMMSLWQPKINSSRDFLTFLGFRLFWFSFCSDENVDFKAKFVGLALRQFWIYRSSLRHTGGLESCCTLGTPVRDSNLTLSDFVTPFLPEANLPVQSADPKSQPSQKTWTRSDFFRRFFNNVPIREKKLEMKKALRRVQRSLSRDRFGSKKNPRSNSQESIDSNLTNKSQNTRPPSELSQVREHFLNFKTI